MSGWAGLVMFAAAAALLLWRGGVAPGLWAVVGATLLFGAAGYALQGRAGLPERLAVADARPVPVAPEIVELRGAMLGRFTGDAAFLTVSDALMRTGGRDRGARVVLRALGSYPRSLTLWTGLGTALAQHDGTVSPAARLAFDQAKRLAPDHPAPAFFEGLAFAESGDVRTARCYWARALALTPPTASYRRDIAMRLAMLDMVIAAQRR